MNEITNIDIQPIYPKPDSVIKKKKKESIKIVLEVISDKEIDPSNLVVEVWAALDDEYGNKKIGFPVDFTEKKDNTYIFSNYINLPYTGYFELEFRARAKHQKFWDWSMQENKKTHVKLWVDPDWTKKAIVYNAFVRFFGAKQIKENGEIKKIQPGTFQDVRKELKKLKSSGINVLYLNPVHPIGELYKNYNPHDLLPSYLQPGCPYSVKDYKSVDLELSFNNKKGIDFQHPFEEFKKLVDLAHKMKIRVIMDMVFNHSAHDSVFQRIHPEWYLYKENIMSLEEPYIYPDEIKKGKPWGDPKHTFCPNDHGYWWSDTAQLNWNNIDKYPDFIMKNISANKPPKNPTIKDMYEYFKNITKFWVKEFGIDGFRCDVAYRVPLDFWKECIIETRNAAKKYHPENKSVDGDVIFIAEDYYVNNKGLLEAGFTACYGDFSNKIHALPELKGYLDYMYNLNGNFFPEGTDWFIFPECHDFHRTPEKVVKYLRKEHPDADLNANKSRWTITACLPGIPMIFNGFEKIEWQPMNLFSYNSIDWESDKDITEHIKKVNLIRQKEEVLQKGNYIYLPTDEGITSDSKIFSFARTYQQETIIVIINLDIVNKAEFVTVYFDDSLPIDYSKEYVLDDLLNKKKYKRTGKEIKVALEPGEAHIFKVQQ